MIAGRQIEHRGLVGAALAGAVRAAEHVDVGVGRALREQQAGNYTIIFPTRLNLKMLDESRTVAEAMSAASARKIVTVLPEPAKLGDERALRIPLEAGYGGDVFPVGSDF